MDTRTLGLAYETFIELDVYIRRLKTEAKDDVNREHEYLRLLPTIEYHLARAYELFLQVGVMTAIEASLDATTGIGPEES